MQHTSLFREEAVDKMLSPDDLDRLMRVTDPKGWLALIGLVALLVPAVVWGVFGSIPNQVTANDGILMHLDALHEVASQTSGIVTDVSVGIGDAVQEGEAIVQVHTDAGAKAECCEPLQRKRGRHLDRDRHVPEPRAADCRD